MNKLFEVFCQN